MKPAFYREQLHKIPELGYQEVKTTAFLKQHLELLDGTLYEMKPTGLVFFFDAGKKESLAFRSDIDGLPITEKTDLPYSSTHSGKMHACGHDGHMSMLLSFADYCNEHLKSLPYNVLLLFQPAEETGSGAQVIIQSGLLEKYQVKGIFGFHVWPGLTKGEVFSKAGGLLAQCSEIDVTVKGKATHIANSEQGVDAVKIGAQLLGQMYQLEEEQFQTFPHLLKFGEIKGGTIRNIIADTCVLKGSLRSFNVKKHQWMKDQLEELAQKLSQKTNSQIDIHYTEGYPVVDNNRELFEKVVHKLPFVHNLEKPFLQGEDFGQYTQDYPSVFFLLGLGDVPPLHNERFDFEMDILEKGVQTYIDLLQLDL